MRATPEYGADAHVRLCAYLIVLGDRSAPVRYTRYSLIGAIPPRFAGAVPLADRPRETHRVGLPIQPGTGRGWIILGLGSVHRTDISVPGPCDDAMDKSGSTAADPAFPLSPGRILYSAGAKSAATHAYTGGAGVLDRIRAGTGPPATMVNGVMSGKSARRDSIWTVRRMPAKANVALSMAK